MDQNQKEGSSDDHHQEGIVNHKSCVDCKTTKTPLWRSGPAGPKSLCNACGIRYRKKSNAMLGINKKKQKTITTKDTTDESQNISKKDVGIASEKEKRLSKDLRVRVMALGKEVVVLQRPRSPLRRSSQKSHRRKLGEVEQAAVLLMALSCGSVFA